MDSKSGRSFRIRVALWCVVGVVASLLILSGGYRWNRARMWTLRGRNGGSVCLVQANWTEAEVLTNCGPRSGRGWQPKVASSGSRVFDLRICSAPGDVYGNKVVLYGCDGRVQAVERMPARGFVYPSN